MKIVRLSKSKVYFESDLSFDVNYDLIAVYNLKEGLDLPFELYNDFLYESCLYKGYKLISAREYSKKTLKDKLMYIYRNKIIVDRVVENFEEKGYVDDYSYAKTFVKNKKYGRNRLEYELKLKGIGGSIISKVMAESEKDEKEEIIRMLYKVEGKDYRKKVEYFMRRGFNLEDILEVIKK